MDKVRVLTAPLVRGGGVMVAHENNLGVSCRDDPLGVTMYYSHETRNAAMRFFASDVTKLTHNAKLMESISSTLRKQYFDALLGDFSALSKRVLYRKSAEALPLTEAIHFVHD